MNAVGRALVACLVTVPSARVAAEDVQPAAPATPVGPQGFAATLAADVHAQIDAMIIAHPPRLVPPTPLKLRYKLAKLGTVELGDPLATMTAGDLDGDGKAELYVVTAREVIAIAADKKPHVVGRIAFTGAPATIRPRDVVATAVVEGATLAAASSPWEAGMRVMWKDGALVTGGAVGGFPQCPGELAQLARGRNWFVDAGNTAPGAGSYGARCTQSVVDGDGYPLRVRAQLSLTSSLDVAVERCAAVGLGCQPGMRYEMPGVGIAFEVADVDRDGALELVHAGAGAPGNTDVVQIVTLGGSVKKPKLRKAFATGVVGIAVADVDGNGAAEVIIAVRAPSAAAAVASTSAPAGPHSIELWRVQ